MISSQLELGKAAEHLVVADLLLSGYQAFLSDAGSPFDIVLSFDNRLFRIQVKATKKARSYTRAKNIYRFQMRHGTKMDRRISPEQIDIIALVALDSRTIAYFRTNELVAKSGMIKQTVDLRDSKSYSGRVYSNGTVRQLNWHLTFDAHTDIAKCLSGII